MTLSNLPVEIWHDIATHYDGMNKPDRARYKELSLVSREFCFAFQPYVFSTISLVIRYHFSRTTGYTHWLLHQQEKLAFFRSPDISFAIRKCVIRAVGAHAEDEVIESYIASLKYFSRLRQLDFIHVIFSHRTFQLLVELDHLPLSIVRMFRCEMSPTAQTMVEGWLSIAQRRKYLNENEDSDYPPVRASGNSLFVLGPNGPPFKLDTLVIDHRYHRGSNDLLILWVKLLCDPNSLKCVSYTNPVCTYPHLIQLPDTTSPPKVFDPDFIPLFSNISRLSISRAIFDNWHDFCLFLRHFTGLQRLRIFPIDADISAQIAFDVSHKLPKLSLLPKLKLLYLFRNKALMQHLLPWQSNPDLQVAPNLQHVIIDETSARTADTVQDIVDWQRGRKVAADGDLAYDERLVSLRIPAGRYFHRHAIPPELSYLRAVCILVGKESPDCIASILCPKHVEKIHSGYPEEGESPEIITHLHYPASIEHIFIRLLEGKKEDADEKKATADGKIEEVLDTAFDKEGSSWVQSADYPNFKSISVHYEKGGQLVSRRLLRPDSKGEDRVFDSYDEWVESELET